MPLEGSHILLGVSGGAGDDHGKTALDVYRWFRTDDAGDPAWDWPEKLLPICYLGCAMYACVDCADPRAKIIWFEPNPREMGEPMEFALIPVNLSLEQWLWAWLHDEVWMYPAYWESAVFRHRYPESAHLVESES